MRRMPRQPVLGDAPRAPYIGRASERAMLDQAYRKVQAGQTQIVTITGEMGIGKSRLWQEWSANLSTADSVLETRCQEATQALPFTPLISLFETNVCLRTLTDPSTSISPIWLAELARVIPNLQTLATHLQSPTNLPFEEERRRLFEAFVQLLLALGNQKLILFVDDVHWSDSALLDWLGYCVHRLREQGLLLVLSYRGEEAPTALVRLVAGWTREQKLVKIPLQRLTEQEATALLTALGADPLLRQRVQADSAGNPLFLIELCRALPENNVPAALSDLIRVKLDRLPETARQVLQAAVILEPEFDFATLRRASGRGEEETLDALDALLAAAILVERSGRYRFSHPLVAKVIREGLSAARKVFLHRRAAEAIMVTQPTLAAPIPAQLAQHYAEANEPARAAQFAELAAEQALALVAPVEAVDFYRQAMALDPTTERRFKLGMAMQRAGDINGARMAFRQALAESGAKGDQRIASQACLELASLSLVSGRFDETQRWAEEMTRYAGDSADPRMLVRREFLLGAGTLQGGGALDEAEMHLQHAIQLATEHHLSDLVSQSRFELGNLLAQRGDLEAALDAYQEAITTAQQLGDQMQEILAHNNYAYHAMLLGRLDAAHMHIEKALALVEANAIVVPRQYLYSTRGEIALAESAWVEAEQWFQRAIGEAEKTGNVVQAANSRANLGLAAQGKGDLDAALLLFETAWRTVDALQAPYLQTQVDLWLTRLHLQRGERVAAEETLRRAEERMQGKDYRRLKSLAKQLGQMLKNA
jgi:predicted ATPase